MEMLHTFWTPIAVAVRLDKIKRVHNRVHYIYINQQKW